VRVLIIDRRSSDYVISWRRCCLVTWRTWSWTTLTLHSQRRHSRPLTTTTTTMMMCMARRPHRRCSASTSTSADHTVTYVSCHAVTALADRRVKPRLHQDTCCRIQVVSTCCRQHVSYISNKIVASLSPVCCWIQRDTSRPWHKWIVILSPRYSQHASWTSNLYPATCVRRHICILIQVACPGHMFPVDQCPGVNAALLISTLLLCYVKWRWHWLLLWMMMM